MKTLTVETKQEPPHNDTFSVGDGGGVLMITPPLDEGFWRYRVRVSPRQALVAFPKFGTIGIGFAVEEQDWNTNLPYTTDAAELWQHIKCNKEVAGDETPTDEECLEALRLLIARVRKDYPPRVIWRNGRQIEVSPID